MNLYKLLAYIMLACIGTDVQSALQPIKASLYTPAATTNYQATYWLTIPQTGTVLIAMKKAESTPAISMKGESNFDYVTDNLSPNKTHFVLPTGLYFWQGNQAKHFSNKPSGGKYFISTSNGYWWSSLKKDARKNPKDKWDATKFAHNPHPFDLKSIPELVQAIPSAASAGSAAAAPTVKTAAEIKTFSISSNNILSEKFYPRHVGTHKDLMQLNVRQQLFTNALNDAKLFKGKNIICLQEWTSQGSLNVPDAYRKSALVNDGAGLLTWVDPQLFTVTSHSFQAFATQGAGQRGFLAVYLHTNDASKRTLCVINTHFVGGPGPNTTTYQKFREDQMQEVAQYIQKNNSKAQSWIVCGDLNSNATQPAIYQAILNQTNQAGLIDAELLTGNQRPATSYNKGPESMDYIFYSANSLASKNISYEPPYSPQTLITHGHLPGDAQKAFYSDHCVVSVVFSFASQASSKTAAAQPAASTASSATAAQWPASYAQPSKKKIADEWTDAHKEIAELITKDSTEELGTALILIESVKNDRTFKLGATNDKGQRLLDIARDAWEGSLGIGKNEEQLINIMNLLQ